MKIESIPAISASTVLTIDSALKDIDTEWAIGTIDGPTDIGYPSRVLAELHGDRDTVTYRRKTLTFADGTVVITGWTKVGVQ